MLAKSALSSVIHSQSLLYTMIAYVVHGLPRSKLMWQNLYVTEYFKSFITVVRRILFTSRALCHKIRYSARGCSSCTLLISKRRLMSTASTITLLPTIRSWMSVVVAMIRRLLWGNLNTVSQISITGCRHTASSKIQKRQNSCGRVPSTVWVNSMVVARQSSLALTPSSPMDTYAS